MLLLNALDANLQRDVLFYTQWKLLGKNKALKTPIYYLSDLPDFPIYFSIWTLYISFFDPLKGTLHKSWSYP